MVNTVINLFFFDISHWLVFLMRVVRVVMMVVVVIIIAVLVNMVYNNWFMVFMSVPRGVDDWLIVIMKGNMWVLSIIVDLST